MRDPVHILRKPRITEKGSALAENKNLVVFEVAKNANKTEIKNAVQSAFNVEVKNVNTMIVRGKIKRRGRSIGQRPSWKKALVTLADGHEIDFFGGTAI